MNRVMAGFVFALSAVLGLPVLAQAAPCMVVTLTGTQAAN